MRYLASQQARFRRGLTIFAAEQNGELRVMHAQTYHEPEADDRWEELAGWALMAFILVLGIAIGWLT